MKQFSGSLLLCLLLLVQPAAFAADCNLAGPSQVATGDVVDLVGTGFTPNSAVVLFVGSYLVSEGKASDVGGWSVAFPFSYDGVFQMEMLSLGGCSDTLEISVGYMDDTTVVTLPEGLIPPPLTQTTFLGSGINFFMDAETLTLSGFNLFDAVTIESDDVQPPQRWEAGVDLPLRWEAALAAAGSDPQAGGASSGGVSSDGSDGAVQDGGTTTDSDGGASDGVSGTTGTNAADSAGVAASPTDPGSDSSVLLLGAITGLVAVLAGLGFGWLLGRRRP